MYLSCWEDRRSISDWVIDRETGEWIELAPDDIVEVIDDGYQINGAGGTREQYEQTINSYLGGTQWQRCIDEKLEESLLAYLYWSSLD